MSVALEPSPLAGDLSPQADLSPSGQSRRSSFSRTLDGTGSLPGDQQGAINGSLNGDDIPAAIAADGLVLASHDVGNAADDAAAGAGGGDNGGTDDTDRLVAWMRSHVLLPGYSSEHHWLQHHTQVRADGSQHEEVSMHEVVVF
eukprot:TRINITY_DN31359_c0_g1_i1.p1 TRINITY_DN31359_c0_g1~~TRINITY_DN31359_c0_g1_i1.p1  ORF type:complete len:144 (-),score=17.81 TRINITY_DN31359_c0_g1_i1:1096-1527(-)